MLESVKRTVAILHYIAQNGNQVRLTDVAENLGVKKTTAHHFLKSLTELGYLEQEERSPRYRLSDKIRLLMPPEMSVVTLKQRYRPVLQALMAQTGETTYLSVQMGAYIRHELKCDPERSVRISLELGKEFAVMHSAIGNVFMAYSAHLEAHILKSLDPAAARQMERLLAQVRQKGYAEDFERLEKELNCIALPVLAHNRIVAAIGISGPAFRFGKDEMKQAIGIAGTYIRQAASNNL